MSYTVIPKFTALVRSDIGGDQDILLTWGISGTTVLKFAQDLTQGAFNTIPLSVNASTSLICIIPPTDNTQAVTLKGVTGDTGTPLATSAPTILNVPLGTLSIGITLGAGSNKVFTFITFS